ncbi:MULTISPECIES: hypothetical protein [unclassified Enterobacter]|uniref:hypothetical protein n=1 Tax=unclassified Enterobacter TaxID=2608935 RepID=UPI0003ECE289|nr:MULTISPECIES: hypothetical protein [unclassified Enterobacter]EWG67616.1 hypothetical protein P349_04687 [Enterobacter sp. DC4]EWG69848.1 hypothetical protein P348_02464 [Enterobacter sp. DC3]
MYIFVIASVILNVLLMFTVIKLYWRLRVDYEPSFLPTVFHHMIKYIRHSGSWDEMEFMRNELRRVLNEIDVIRHDAGNVRLRKTKPVRDA